VSVPVPRTGGRLLLVDPDGRLLLIHESLEFGGSHWLTPGGGTEGDELPAAAAVREGAEEIGCEVRLAPDAEPVLVTRRLWSWAGVTYDQTDHFFLVRVPRAFEPVPQRLTDVERATLLGHKWWTGEQLRRTADELLPANLADVLADVLSRLVRRHAGRALLIDPAGRVLLVHEQLEAGAAHWLTPGGGVEAGETPAEAAAREAREETGIVVEFAPDERPVFRDRVVWSWAGTTYDQQNEFFAAAVPAGLTPAPARLTELERLTHLGLRWWAATELRATAETFYPAALPDVLDRVCGELLASG
jgi:8-oxo-dGTP pyrophosphatase MutT (NUDIX family)